MSCNNLKGAIIDGTPPAIVNWILFTNRHHNEHRTHDETVAKFKGTVLGSYIDFNKLEELNMPKDTTETPSVSNIEPEAPRTKVTIQLDDEQAGELFHLLEGVKDQHPELHELVYQAMAKTLFSRINRG
jgi:hypothetical protein